MAIDIDTGGRVSVMALGYMVGAVPVAHILAAGSYVGGKLGYELTVTDATLNSAVIDAVLCGSAGKVFCATRPARSSASRTSARRWKSCAGRWRQ